MRIHLEYSFPGVLDWLRIGLFAAGIGVLGFACRAYLDNYFYQRDSTLLLEQLHSRAPSAELPAEPVADRPMPVPEVASLPNGAIARMTIPARGLSAVVAEGIEESTLRRAIGHIPGTARFGEPGNIGLAGHRDTLLRSLRRVERGDRIKLRTLDAQYEYEVNLLAVVSPNDVHLLQPGDGETLTIVTCFPFRYVGPAPKRYIVQARRVEYGESR